MLPALAAWPTAYCRDPDCDRPRVDNTTRRPQLWSTPPAEWGGVENGKNTGGLAVIPILMEPGKNTGGVALTLAAQTQKPKALTPKSPNP